MRIFSPAPLLALLVAITLLPLAALGQGRPATVGIDRVETRVLAETLPVFAEVVTARDGAVATRVAGNVQAVHVLDGQSVARGELLVELDQELLRIRVTQSEAQLVEAQAGIDTARTRVERTSTNFARIDGLRGSSSFSQGRFDDAQADLAEARSQLVEAQARLKSGEARLAESRYQLDNAKITAPFPGVVIAVNTIPGAFLQAGAPVVRLLDTQAFEVQASVPARYVPFLQPGQTLQGATETGAALSLELRALLPLEDPATRTRAVRFAVPDLGALTNVAVGQSLTVDVPVGESRAVLSVPKDALIQARGGWTVFVDSDGAAEIRSVQIGQALGDRYEVLDGLAEGDAVVVRGNERLRPNQPIAAAPMETN